MIWNNWRQKETEAPDLRVNRSLQVGFAIGLAIFFTGADAASASSISLEKAGQSLFCDTQATGMIFVVVQGKDSQVFGYGSTQPDGERIPDEHSLLRLGSLSKLFAGELLVDLVEQGEVRLDEPLQEVVGDNRHVPASGRPITLLDLATHSAGLPRSLDGSSLASEPYSVARWRWLSMQTRLPIPGSEVRYSNLGYDLLADALAERTGLSYERALSDRLLKPIGMLDTVANPTSAQCHRLMQGMPVDHNSACRDQVENAGSGGMYSTGADIAKWLAWQLDDSGAGSSANQLDHAIYLQRQAPRVIEGLDIGGHADGVGLGWIWLQPSDKHPGVLEKTGGGGGFMSYAALVPGQHIGIFVAVTRVDVPMLQTIAEGVLKLAGELERVD